MVKKADSLRFTLILFSLSLPFPLSIFDVTLAEPWLGNRFAQNCAGCHAPGRKNLPISKRRCTLACQGCHVNPNGSGLRNHYGKWTEDRWLRSFRSETLVNAKSFAIYPKQPYANPPDKIPERWVFQGPPLKEIDQLEMREPLYDRRDGLEKVEATSRREFVLQVPQGDPYRQQRATKIDGGADLRWQVQSSQYKLSTENASTDGELYQNFLMVADLGLRWRPVYRQVHFVYEGRYLGQPDEKDPDQVLATMARRNLYLLIEDLPYATYFMAGYYRPIFGSPNPDHTLLSQRMISQALQDNSQGYDLSYRAISIGGSPNVPFANLSIIGRQYGTSPTDTHKGWALNGGGRFVTLGASATYSYWRSKRETTAPNGSTVEARVEMSAIGLGAQFWRTTVMLDGVAIAKDVPQYGFFSGSIWSLETYTRTWREIYYLLGYHRSNIAETLVPGSGEQIRTGLRAFLLPGLDLSLILRKEKQNTFKRDSRTSAQSRTFNAWAMQLHLYI